MSTATLTVRLLSTAAELDAVAEGWNTLAAGVPMRGHLWLTGWLRHYQDEAGEPFVPTVWRDETLIGLAPWRTEHSVKSGRTIRWLGDGQVCTDHLSILASEADRSEVVYQLADWLVNEHDAWDVVDLDHCDADDPAANLLFDLLQQQGCHTQSAQDDACWAIQLPNDWQAFLARQSKSHRKQLRRAERRVLESADCQWRAVRTPDDWRQAWPILVDLHQRRRQSLGEPGCFASQRFTQFHQELSLALLQRGQLRMSWLELGGTPAAAEYHFAGAGAVYAYQGGVDPDRLDEEPGRLSNIATLQDAIRQQQTTFDFLRGDEPYKAHWRAVAQPTLRRRAAAPRNTARLRAQASWAAESAKGLLKTGLASLTR